MLKKILLVVITLLIAFISLGVYLNSQANNKLNALLDPLQADLEKNSLTSTQEIINYLDQASCPPISSHSEGLSKHLLLDRYQQKYSTDIPNSLQKKPASDFPQLDFDGIPIFIYQDTLYLAQINYDNPEDVAKLQAISPQLANSIIACYFTNRDIPVVSNLYLKSFQEDSTQRKTTLETEIADIQNRLSKPNLTPELTTSLNSSLHARETQLQNLTLHLGYFAKPNSITLIISDKHNSHPDRFLATLVHEHMHFISYTPSHRLERFFYDGLADYFTDQALKNIDRSYEISYIEPVKIITDMLQDIPEGDFATIMLTNDQTRLEQLIDTTYGHGFYDNHRQLFLTTVDRLDNYQAAAQHIRDDIHNIRTN